MFQIPLLLLIRGQDTEFVPTKSNSYRLKKIYSNIRIERTNSFRRRYFLSVSGAHVVAGIKKCRNPIILRIGSWRNFRLQ